MEEQQHHHGYTALPNYIFVATLPAMWGIRTRRSPIAQETHVPEVAVQALLSLSLKFRAYCVQVDLNDVESSTILSFRYITEMGEGLSGLDKRQALKDWLELLALSHPLKR